jgi:GNAT superfamily N-acetyltransferase
LGPGLEEALQKRPQVIVLDEDLGCARGEWDEVFTALLCSEGLRNFKGAVIVCVADETRALAPSINECWVATGRCLRQEAYLEVIQHDFSGGCNGQACDLLQEALEIDTLKFWIDDAKKNCQTVSLFASCTAADKKSIRGFVCHHMKPRQAEFHVRFIFVPSEHRGNGFGRRLVQWIIASASRMPQSTCNWISLDAAYEALVPWYETFGFTDMTCGADEYGQIWMERRNVSVVEDIKSCDFAGSDSDESS